MPKLLTTTTLPKYASAPDNPMLGDMYFNTTDDSTYIYTVVSNVNTWIKLGGRIKTQVYSTPGSYTWTRPENVQWIKAVVVIGAGGGGGAGAIKTGNGDGKKAATGGGGGGGGSIAIGYDIYVGDISTISVNVPSGGAGGVAHTFSKTAGSTSNFNSNPANAGSNGSGNATFGSYISCPSGSGGGGGLTNAGTTSVAGGAGGIAGTTPTVSGIYLYSSSTGSAGGAGGAIVAALPQSGTSSTQSTASTSADGSSRSGMNRIQWSTSTLGAPSGLQNASVSAGAFTISTSGSVGSATGFAVISGGNGGPAAMVDGAAISAAGSSFGTRARSATSVAAWTSSSAASTLTVDMKKPDNGGNYGNGGAGGPAFSQGTSTSPSYDAHAFNITGSAGGDGANGLVSIAWVE